jgi:hypothetical protein
MRTLMQQKAFDLKYEMLCERTRRRQETAKAALVRQGITPRAKISTGYVKPQISRVFVYTNVGGVR